MRPGQDAAHAEPPTQSGVHRADASAVAPAIRVRRRDVAVPASRSSASAAGSLTRSAGRLGARLDRSWRDARRPRPQAHHDRHDRLDAEADQDRPVERRRHVVARPVQAQIRGDAEQVGAPATRAAPTRGRGARRTSQTDATRRTSTASPIAASTSSTLTPNTVGSSENVRRISGSLPRRRAVVERRRRVLDERCAAPSAAAARAARASTGLPNC